MVSRLRAQSESKVARYCVNDEGPVKAAVTPRVAPGGPPKGVQLFGFWNEPLLTFQVKVWADAEPPPKTSIAKARPPSQNLPLHIGIAPLDSAHDGCRAGAMTPRHGSPE